MRPLKKHFPVVGTPVSASWVKGSIGQPPSRIELPSPSSTALDAVVELEPAVAAKLHDELADADQSAMPSADPDVAPALRSALPGGPYIVAKNNLGSTYGWSATVYLSRDRPVLVLHAFLPWATGFTE
ncbi:hypothetical protein [Gordonia araii]|uniref:hypothetical protein n=1 Tax=Gordonia araii TaxID=263909 RepID=UPI0002DA4A2C|nr:hypothetical protein [Gordonia araii]NNG97691.1 hypothetical protein [Gordonia araii NBRC 100433]